MKIKIDEDGLLSIYRRGKYREQFCPFNPSDAASCGEWCPMFHLVVNSHLEENGFKYTYSLYLCHTEYFPEKVEGYYDVATESCKPSVPNFKE